MRLCRRRGIFGLASIVDVSFHRFIGSRPRRHAVTVFFLRARNGKQCGAIITVHSHCIFRTTGSRCAVQYSAFVISVVKFGSSKSF